MKSIFLFSTLLGLVLAKDIPTEQIPVEVHWQSFKLEYGKNYQDHSEELLRMQIFKDNKDVIDKHNLRYAAGEETYTMGLNEFSDWSDEEFVDRMLSKQLNNSLSENADYVYSSPENWDIPQSMDWRNYGAVTPVKNQSPCGSCYCFAAVATLETYQFRLTERLVALSEQNALDCTSGAPYGNFGCIGGRADRVLPYVQVNGLNTERSYPYRGQLEQCRYNVKNVGVKINGFFRIEMGNEAQLALVVASYGPVAVVISVAGDIRHYRDGLYTSTMPSSGLHALAVVGYGHDQQSGDFWTLKNSWGTTWGSNGYFTIPRNRDPQVNIANDAVFPY